MGPMPVLSDQQPVLAWANQRSFFSSGSAANPLLILANCDLLSFLTSPSVSRCLFSLSLTVGPGLPTWS